MKPRGRPRKTKIIREKPEIVRFSPRGKPGRPDEVELSMEEFEAIRLVDYSGMSQREAARSMQVSQQTISRIIRQARRKLADSFINGKIIKIEAAEYTQDEAQNTHRDAQSQAREPSA